MSLRGRLVRSSRAMSFLRLHRKYREHTMASASVFWRNLRIVDANRHVQGCVVECGVWRGGMSAGMAEVLGPSREYFLFDSFEDAFVEWLQAFTMPTLVLASIMAISILGFLGLRRGDGDDLLKKDRKSVV